MCTNMRQVRNRYTGTVIYTPCGHCKACQQAKAQRRKRRILNNNKYGYIALSVTLTYDNFAVPYVYRDDIIAAEKQCSCLSDESFVKVHRRCVDRYVRHGSGYDIVRSRKLVDNVIENRCVRFKTGDSSHLHDLKRRRGRIGVLFYKDVQDFNKRLKQFLIRKYNHDGKFSYIVAGEYGEHTLRPHWHLLIFCRSCELDVFRSACRSCWTFGDMCRERRIEVAKNMAGYIASYINRGSEFPSFLAENFPPATHYSMGFGCNNAAFTCTSIVSKARRCDMSYVVPSSTSPSGYCNVLLPKYAINRFFPTFKGCTRIADSTLYDVLQSRDGTRLCYDANFKRIGYTEDELNSISVRLQHCYERYFLETGCDSFLYADDWMQVYRSYASELIKQNHIAPNAAPLNERYYNLNELYTKYAKRYCIGDFPDFIEVNPNNFSSVVAETERLTEYFNNYCKYKSVNNFVMSQTDEQV